MPVSTAVATNRKEYHAGRNRIYNRMPGCWFAARGPSMRQAIVFSLFALLAVTAANDARAQRYGRRRVRLRSSWLRPERLRFPAAPGPCRPTDTVTLTCPPIPTTPATRTFTRPSRRSLQPACYLFSPAGLVPPASRAARRRAAGASRDHGGTKWPVAHATSSRSVPSATSGSEPQAFAIVLKDGSTLSAVSVFSSDDGLHYVDPDERHLRVSMSEVDRAATLKLNRARNLNLYLPAPQ